MYNSQYTWKGWQTRSNKPLVHFVTRTECNMTHELNEKPYIYFYLIFILSLIFIWFMILYFLLNDNLIVLLNKSIFFLFKASKSIQSWHILCFKYVCKLQFESRFWTSSVFALWCSVKICQPPNRDPAVIWLICQDPKKVTYGKFYCIRL